MLHNIDISGKTQFKTQNISWFLKQPFFSGLYQTVGLLGQTEMPGERDLFSLSKRKRIPLVSDSSWRRPSEETNEVPMTHAPAETMKAAKVKRDESSGKAGHLKSNNCLPYSFHLSLFISSYAEEILTKGSTLQKLSFEMTFINKEPKWYIVTSCRFVCHGFMNLCIIGHLKKINCILCAMTSYFLLINNLSW